MLFTETPLKGAYIIDLKKIEDERGFFARAFCKSTFESMGLNGQMLQTNISSNHKQGTLRGLHMQVDPHGEVILVRCTKGAIYDVIVDMRSTSPTFLQWFGVELTEENFRMLYVPTGFAHGYLTLADATDVTYQVSEVYVPGAERGYRWDDPAFNIQWPLEPNVISAKDQAHLPFKQVIEEANKVL